MTETTVHPLLGAPPAGHPGTPPRWRSARKQGFGAARGPDSHVWFTLADGVVTEAYHPTVDSPRIAGCELWVSDGRTFAHAEGRDMRHQLAMPDPGVPAYEVASTDPANRYRLHKRVIADPRREALLIEVRYEALRAAAEGYALYVDLEPLLAGDGRHTNAHVERHVDRNVLVASRGGAAVALACSRALPAVTIGYAGVSDGPTELLRDHRLSESFTKALDGHVGLTARIAYDAEPFIIAIGFGATAIEAVNQAMIAAAGSFDHAWETYVRGWQEALALYPLERLSQHTHDQGRLLRSSAMVLAALEDKRHPGAAIGSPSTPWGESTAAEGVPGAQVVRPRDLYHMATARLALGDDAGAARSLAFLIRHQRGDGSWPNEMATDGRAWSGGVPSQVAYPILLAWRLREIVDPVASGAWTMVKAAALHLAMTRPVTGPEAAVWRSHSVGTLAAEVAALACADELATLAGDAELAGFFGELARIFASDVDRAAFGPCARCEAPASGHYRHAIAPARQGTDEAPFCDIDASFLDLVRFGLRDAPDPRLESSLAAMDKHLRVVAPHAPAWRRYHGDLYGEPAPDGGAAGRAWPLLTGERGHHELALGHTRDATHLAHAMERLANKGGLLPEQVWDEATPPGEGLPLLGRGTGAATPHGWAHAEYVKLVRSIADGRLFDGVTATHRVLGHETPPPARWCFAAQPARLTAGRALRIEALAPAELRWSWDGWRTWGHAPLKPAAPGIWAWTSPGPLEAGDRLAFTFYWPASGTWEGRNYHVAAE